MTQTWQSGDEPEHPKISLGGWIRIIWRGGLLAILTFGCLLILLLVRLIERPVWNQHRPWTPHITQFVCRTAFLILGMKFESTGDLMREKGAVVANHSSWLDIFALNARKRIYFVSKSEVADWPAIGWLARATGTVFIRRHAREALNHKEIIGARLRVGHKLLFFPEGTSTDGLRVLPFKPTLFAAMFEPVNGDELYVQPVTVVYQAPEGQSPRFYGWWGDMEFGPHFLMTLSARPQGAVKVVYHPPVRVADFNDRKALAKHCEDVVRSALQVAAQAEDTAGNATPQS